MRFIQRESERKKDEGKGWAYIILWGVLFENHNQRIELQPNENKRRRLLNTGEKRLKSRTKGAR